MELSKKGWEKGRCACDFDDVVGRDAAERQVAVIDPEILEDYQGRYQLLTGLALEIKRKGDQLIVQDEDGTTVAVRLTQGGRELKGDRIREEVFDATVDC